LLEIDEHGHEAPRVPGVAPVPAQPALATGPVMCPDGDGAPWMTEIRG
jgi:hypothetical protein